MQIMGAGNYIGCGSSKLVSTSHESGAAALRPPLRRTYKASQRRPDKLIDRNGQVAFVGRMCDDFG